jgi:hypothetical protein
MHLKTRPPKNRVNRNVNKNVLIKRNNKFNR